MSQVERREPGASRFVMVTGASSGIGRAVAARLADAGHVVFAAARRASALEALATEHPNARPLVMDVTEQASIYDAREQVQVATAGQGLDALVNAAGRLLLGPVEAMSDEQIRALFDVNLFGLLAVTRVFVPRMRDRGAGRVVNISSILGSVAFPGMGPYAASKFAIEACSDAMRMELAPYGVRVVLVEPDVTDTPLYESASGAQAPESDALAPYRSTWPAGFGFPQRLLRTAASADRIAAEVVEAVLAADPRPRYRPGLRNRMRTALLTALPTPAADRIKMRLVGMAKRARPAG